MFDRKLAGLVPVLALVVPLAGGVSADSRHQAAAGQDTILKAADISLKIFPERVFYRGRVATVQMRNTGGVHFADDMYWLAGLVDVSGYSSSVREKYQGYFLNEVALDVNGQPLKPGAYGIGFVTGSKFIVTDLGSNTLLEVAGQRDADLKMPMPLQVIAAPAGGGSRLYLGRDYVTLKRTR
jgi:hypothetical protein